MSSVLDKCFEKHSFEELNNIDYGTLSYVVKTFLNMFPESRNGVFFDIGCNAGSFVKTLQHMNIRDNIHCFEPHPVLVSRTMEQYPYIHMNPYCITNKVGMIDIHIPQWSVGLSSIINRPVFAKLAQEITVINVKCNTIDNYCKENNIERIDFVKIDVEGAEKCVFEGACEMLKNNKIKGGLFEVGSTLTDAGTSESELCDLLESYGYTINKSLSLSDYFFYTHL